MDIVKHPPALPGLPEYRASASLSSTCWCSGHQVSRHETRNHQALRNLAGCSHCSSAAAFACVARALRLYAHWLLRMGVRWSYVTADDDAPGGWSNPDGLLPFLWVELLIKALVLGALFALAALSPAIRGLGGPS